MNDTNGSQVHALVLAAGEGSRLRKYASPKPLLQVAGMPPIGRVLRGLKEAGGQNVWIVVGYRGDVVRQQIGEYYAGLTIRYIEELIEFTHLSEASVGFAIISVMTDIYEISIGVGGKFILFAAILNVILR